MKTSVQSPARSRLGFLSLLFAFVLTVAFVACTAEEQTGEEAEGAASEPADATADQSQERQRPQGLVSQTDEVAPGYVLFSPLSSGTTYLVDTEARVVKTWQSTFAPHSLYLLANGNLLRPGRDPEASNFMAGGAMGYFEMWSWEGELLWQWKFSDDEHINHHDIEPLPNGNFLAIGFEQKTREEALAVGRRADRIPEKGVWPDFIMEIEPLPPDDARIVWEWHTWDHLVQNIDPELPNYREPSEHPGRVDINALSPEISKEELEQLRAIGYVAQEAEAEDLSSDIHHLNALDYHPGLDQIATTSPSLSEVWIIRRPRSTEEAKGAAGDLLYRWGNPQVYGRGTAEDQVLFGPHDVQWIPEGTENAGQLTIFNNGRQRPAGNFSSVEQMAPPLLADGTYILEDGKPYGPSTTTWSYSDEENFFAAFISGAHRLPNGHTFITAGPQGRLFEVTGSGEVVWDFWNPYRDFLRRKDGSPLWGGGGGGRRGGGADRLAYAVWRAQKLSPDSPGLEGRELEPLDPQPSVGESLAAR